MRILQITPYFLPNVGGVQQRVNDLSRRLILKGHKIVIITSNIKIGSEKIRSTKNLKLEYLKAFKFANTPIAFGFGSKINKYSYFDLAHIHVAQPLFPEIGGLFCRLNNIPYVAHVRIDLQPSGIFGFLLPFYKKYILKPFLTRSSRIIVLTEDYKEIVSKKYSIDKGLIKVIPNSTDFRILRRLPKKINDPMRILFVGRICKQKNLPLLIDSFEKISNKYSLVLDIVGDGPDTEKVKKLIMKKKLQNKVIMKGIKKGRDLEEIYKKSDIFILTSRQESFGTVLIEAMASGIPIVANKIPAVRNVIKDGYNGLLVKPTPENLAKAIERLINNPKLREKLAKNGLKEVKKYSWDKVVDQTIEVYKEVLAEHANKNKQK
jgi:glycosyltransferase involved in cell wall biosynthesis